ncbi:DUF2807 domain-containing protein [Pantoea sp. 18069]|uniref:GIN domain-containing protein n=1 Tax=Pantoea sp. 18069 TaxID=2681415 RepID=UPI0013592704|nr:DUF2807 domain-containing protein [Pantoea sp. 18069]
MANITRRSALLCAGLLAGALISAPGSGAAAALQKESRPVQPVKQLVARGAIDVWVKRGPPAMQVIAEKPENVVTNIRNGVLTIAQKPAHSGAGDGCFRIGNFGVTFRGGLSLCGEGQKVTIELSLPELPSAHLEGAVDLRLDDVRQDAIELAIAGAGGIRVSGAVKHLSVKISGAGDVRAKDLHAQSAELQVAGSGDIEAHVTQSLSAHIAGAGDIAVWGNPAQRDTRVLGAGNIRFK